MRTLTATVRSSAACVHRYTTPEPPRPISWASSNPAAANSAVTEPDTSRCVANESTPVIGYIDSSDTIRCKGTGFFHPSIMHPQRCRGKARSGRGRATWRRVTDDGSFGGTATKPGATDVVSGMGEPKRRDSLCFLKELDCLLTRPPAVDVAAVPFPIAKPAADCKGTVLQTGGTGDLQMQGR